MCPLPLYQVFFSGRLSIPPFIASSCSCSSSVRLSPLGLWLPMSHPPVLSPSLFVPHLYHPLFLSARLSFSFLVLLQEVRPIQVPFILRSNHTLLDKHGLRTDSRSLSVTLWRLSTNASSLAVCIQIAPLLTERGNRAAASANTILVRCSMLPKDGHSAFAVVGTTHLLFAAFFATFLLCSCVLGLVLLRVQTVLVALCPPSPAPYVLLVAIGLLSLWAVSSQAHDCLLYTSPSPRD